MLRAVFAAILALAPGAALAATFELSLDDINGERVVVVALEDGSVFAVAAGDEDLKVLRGEEADRARASLTKMEGADLAEPETGGETRKRKVIIHKMDVEEEGGGAGDQEKSVIRVIRKTDGERSEEALLDDEAEALVGGDASPEGAIERRVIRLKGADEARAIKFIDETKGLDVGEKAEMKKAVGL